MQYMVPAAAWTCPRGNSVAQGDVTLRLFCPSAKNETAFLFVMARPSRPAAFLFFTGT